MEWDQRIGRRLKLRDLNILLAVTEAGSMARAATRLAISQPAVSRAVADMEQTLGVKLFDRSPQGIEPTRYGQALLRRSIAIFDELKQGVEDLAYLADPTTGELRIGSNPGVAEGIVLAVIERLSHQYPRLVFQIVLGGLIKQLDILRERRVELGFARLPTKVIGDDIQHEILFEEGLVVVSGLKTPWARRRELRLTDIANERLTWPPVGTFFDTLIVEAFEACGVKAPSATVYAEAFSMRIRLAATGQFLAFVPESLLRFSALQSAVQKLPIALPTTRRPVGVLTIRNRTLSPLAQLFVDCARDQAKVLWRD
jgi:DNA-binding transcriptional LysR family regulator